MLWVAVLYTKEKPDLNSEGVKYIFIDCNVEENIFDVAGLCLNGFILVDNGVPLFCQKYILQRVRVI